MFAGVLYPVFKKPRYLAFAVVTACLVFTLAIWLPHINLIITVLGSETALVTTKGSFLWSLYGSITTNFTLLSASYTIIIAILFGINISLLIYYIKKIKGGVRTIRNTSATSLSGLISGILGIGCATCGTFVLTSVLALFGVSGIIAFLPFGGGEFGFLGVIIMLYSTSVLLKKMNTPLVCPVRNLQ